MSTPINLSKADLYAILSAVWLAPYQPSKFNLAAGIFCFIYGMYCVYKEKPDTTTS